MQEVMPDASRIGMGEPICPIRPEWHLQAACRGKYDEVHPKARGDSSITKVNIYLCAKALASFCAECPVIRECGEEAERLKYRKRIIEPPADTMRNGLRNRTLVALESPERLVFRCVSVALR